MSQRKFTIRVKLSITNGVGDVVLGKIGEADIPKMVVDGTGGAGRVVSQAHEWDSGYFSHDLYLLYHVTVDCNKTVSNASWFLGGIVNFFNASASIVRGKLRDTFREGFEEKMVFGLCSVTSVEIWDNHLAGARF